MSVSKEEKKYFKLLKQKGDEINDLLDRIKYQELQYNLCVKSFNKKNKSLEDQKKKLKKEEDDLRQKYYAEIEKEPYFKKPPTDKAKQLVEDSKLKKKRIENKKKNLQKEEQNLKQINDDLKKKIDELPEEKKELYYAMEKEVLKTNKPKKNERKIINQNKPLANFLKKVCERYKEKRKEPSTIEDFDNDTDMHPYIIRLLQDDDDLYSKKGRALSASKGDAITSATDNKTRIRNDESFRALTSISSCQEYDNLGPLNYSFFLRSNKIKDERLKSKPDNVDQSAMEELNCTKCRREFEKSKLLLSNDSTLRSISYNQRPKRPKNLKKFFSCSMLKQRKEKKRRQYSEILIGDKYYKQSLIGRATNSELGIIHTIVKDTPKNNSTDNEYNIDDDYNNNPINQEYLESFGNNEENNSQNNEEEQNYEAEEGEEYENNILTTFHNEEENSNNEDS